MFKKNSIYLLSLTIVFIFSNRLLSDGKTPKVIYKLEKDIPYRSEDISKQTAYMKERCKLDFYHPENKKGFATVIMFHGGGLIRGRKYVPRGLRKQGIAVVAPTYRFSPKVKCPAYIEDAAAAVAWTFKNIARYGGDPDKIFVSGLSGGAYLAGMVVLDKKYLSKYNIDANKIAGLISLTGHAITHLTVRYERGLKGNILVIDKYAPIFHAREDAPPILIVTGDRNMEFLGRYEENAYMMRILKLKKHKDTTLYEIQGYGHGIGVVALPILLRFVDRRIKEIDIKNGKIKK